MMKRHVGCAIAAMGVALAVVLVASRPAAADVRSIDGKDNNSDHASWGAAGEQLLRLSAVDYPDDQWGATILLPPARPNPREISNAIFPQTASKSNRRGMTNGVWLWGQFVDHDVSLTASSSANGTAHIMAPSDDPYGMSMIPFNRSNFDPLTGTSDANPRQQINAITSYIDASNVYGSDGDRALKLRIGVGGKLKSGAGNLLPLNTDDAELGTLFMDDGGSGATPLFVAGDVRANEHVGLTAMHTLFVREHNRLAQALADNHPGDPSWDDERIYQTARKIVGAEIQAITYNEFLPAVLGPYAPRAADYRYSTTVNASIASEFSTALYRVGHTMLSGSLMIAGDGGSLIDQLALRDAFFRPDRIMADPALVEHVLMGLCMSQSQEIDAKIVDDVRNFLFAPTGGVGMDLASLNIQRGRDHGLPDYNTVRTYYQNPLNPAENLPAVSSFIDITSDPTLRSALATLYGDVGNVDLWVGALAEDHVPGASVGPLILAGLVDQFTRLRDGDAFFFAGDSDLQSPDVASLVNFNDLTFIDLMVWNTSLTGMPGSFFMAAVPEPAAWLLMAGAGAAALAAGRRRGRHRAQRANRRSWSRRRGQAVQGRPEDVAFYRSRSGRRSLPSQDDWGPYDGCGAWPRAAMTSAARRRFFSHHRAPAKMKRPDFPRQSRGLRSGFVGRSRPPSAAASTCVAR